MVLPIPQDTSESASGASVSDLKIQASFNTGEWAPSLNARVDLAKYRSAAALLQNWIVDYRGGASTRPGTKYILQAYKSATAVRLIPFQASLGVGYVLEFGDNYIRFYNDGAPVLETATSITAAAAGPPEVFTDTAHGYANGDWIYVSSNYYIVQGVTINTYTLTDLYGVAIATNPFTLPAAASRVYTLTTAYAATDIGLLKYAQNVNALILCHPNYQPQVLTLNGPTNWSLVTIQFGTTIGTPSGVSVATTLSSGSVNYAYVVTAVDINGQESSPSTPAQLNSYQDIRSVAGTNVITWTAVSGAVSYNVYEAEVSYFGVVPTGASYGFIGNVTGTTFTDSNIGPDFSTTPPIARNPFLGAGVASYTITAGGLYSSTAPTVTIGASSGGAQATAAPVMGISTLTWSGHVVTFATSPNGSIWNFDYGISIEILTSTFITNSGDLYYYSINTISIISPGAFSGTSFPTSLTPISANIEYYAPYTSWTIDPTLWTLEQIQSIITGSGYTSAPTVTISPQGSTTISSGTYNSGTGLVTLTVAANRNPVPGDSIVVSGATGTGSYASINGTFIAGAGTTGTTITYTIATGLTMTITGGSISVAAAAIAVLGMGSAGNPSVPGLFQQRLVLAGPSGQPQQFNMSQTGLYYNFDVHSPIQADDAIQGSLVSGQQNTIKSMAPVASGLLMLSDRASWLLNGGSAGSAVSPSALVANAQSYIGASDVPPIIVNYDVLFVQAKGSIIRDNTFNIYVSVITGQDISILSSHLFYGYTILQWAWAEEPFKVVWAIRNDGTMLTLTFMKEQDFIGWTHSVTQGSFLSVATVTEATSTAGEVDAIYTVVQRTVNGQTLKYIERVVERTFPNGVVDAWCVDAGIQYVGAPTTTFSGATHLAGLTVTGLADGVIIPPFVMPTNGTFTLGTAASKVTVGLGYTCDLQTLAIDVGEPTVQGKVKKIPSVDVRVADTLGLSIGPDFNHLVPMKDLIQGNVSSMLTGQQSQVVTDLVTGDARTYLAPAYTVPGQYCIRQSNPMPASVLGVIPNVVVGDDR